MTRDDLYEVAFRYKKAGLWKKLWDGDLWALRLKTGKIGYISIMGRNGEYNGLGLYIGEKGFMSFRRLTKADEYIGDEIKRHELLLSQNCLQLSLENKDYLMPEEVDEVRDYAKRHGIKLAGKNAYPQFIKYEPGYHPWKIVTDEDMESLHDAIEAAIMMANCLEKDSPSKLGIMPFMNVEEESVPLFVIQNGDLIALGRTTLPADKNGSEVYVPFENDILTMSLKKLKRNGIWEAEYVRVPQPVQENSDEAPYYPMMIMVIESISGYLLPVKIGDVKDDKKNLLSFAECWNKEERLPQKILCHDERTYALLKDFCDKTNTEIELYEGFMQALEDAKSSIFGHMLNSDPVADDMGNTLDFMDELCDMLAYIDHNQLNEMPKSMISDIKDLMRQGIIPDGIVKHLEKEFKKM